MQTCSVKHCCQQQGDVPAASMIPHTSSGTCGGCGRGGPACAGSEQQPPPREPCSGSQQAPPPAALNVFATPDQAYVTDQPVAMNGQASLTWTAAVMTQKPLCYGFILGVMEHCTIWQHASQATPHTRSGCKGDVCCNASQEPQS